MPNKEYKKQIEELSSFDMPDTLTKRHGYDIKIMPVATSDNMNVMIDKINELVQAVNELKPIK